MVRVERDVLATSMNEAGPRRTHVNKKQSLHVAWHSHAGAVSYNLRLRERWGVGSRRSEGKMQRVTVGR